MTTNSNSARTGAFLVGHEGFRRSGAGSVGRQRLFLSAKPVPRNCSTKRWHSPCARRRIQIQPWRVFSRRRCAGTGWSRRCWSEATLGSGDQGPSGDVSLPLRQELGALVYGSMGIARHDKEGRRLAQLRNWEFFRVPVERGGVHAPRSGTGRQPGRRDVPADAGAGVDRTWHRYCVQASIAAYPEILRAHLRIPEELTRPVRPVDRLPRPRFPGENLSTPRNPIETNVVFLDS